jgi:hypothetical protein
MAFFASFREQSESRKAMEVISRKKGRTCDAHARLPAAQ